MGSAKREQLRQVEAQEKDLPYWKGNKAMMTIPPARSNDFLDMPDDVTNDIDVLRGGDDNIGTGVAVFGFHLTNNVTLTPMDKIVAAQILWATAANLLNDTVLTKNNLDKIGALKNTTIMSSIGSLGDETSGIPGLHGDAEREELDAIIKYVSMYNKDIKDETIRWTESDVAGDDEGPVTMKWWAKLLDYIPLINMGR